MEPDTWIAAASAVVTVLALVVAILARKDSRRSSRAGEQSANAADRSATASELSAATGETSARAAQRSADAAEAANAMQAEEAEQRRTDRHDVAGPQFEPDGAYVLERAVPIRLRMAGGPGRVAVEVRPAEVPWCEGLSISDDTKRATSVWYPPMEPGDEITLTAHLAVDLWRGHQQLSLPLIVTATSREAPPRVWERRVSVLMRPPPEVH